MAHRQARAHRAAETDTRDTETPARSHGPRPKAQPLYDHAAGASARAQPVVTARANDPTAALAANVRDPAALHGELRSLAYQAAPDPGASQRLQQAARSLAEQNDLDAAELVTAAADAIAEARRAPDFTDRFVQTHMATGREDVGRAALALSLVAEHADGAALARAIVARATAQGRGPHALQRLQAFAPGLAPASCPSQGVGTTAAPASSARATCVQTTASAQDAGPAEAPGPSGADRWAGASLDELRAKVLGGLPGAATAEETVAYAHVVHTYAARLHAACENLSLAAAGRAAMYRAVQIDRISAAERLARSCIDILNPLRTRPAQVANQMDEVSRQAAELSRTSGKLGAVAGKLLSTHERLQSLGALDYRVAATARKTGKDEAELAHTGAITASLTADVMTGALKGLAASGPCEILISAAIDGGLATIGSLADQSMNGHGARPVEAARVGIAAAAWSTAQGVAVSKFNSLFAGSKARLVGHLGGTVKRVLGNAQGSEQAAELVIDALQWHLVSSVTGAFDATARRAAKGDLSASEVFAMVGREAAARASNGQQLQRSVAGTIGAGAGVQKARP